MFGIYSDKRKNNDNKIQTKVNEFQKTLQKIGYEKNKQKLLQKERQVRKLKEQKEKKQKQVIKLKEQKETCKRKSKNLQNRIEISKLN